MSYSAHLSVGRSAACLCAGLIIFWDWGSPGIMGEKYIIIIDTSPMHPIFSQALRQKHTQQRLAARDRLRQANRCLHFSFSSKFDHAEFRRSSLPDPADVSRVTLNEDYPTVINTFNSFPFSENDLPLLLDEIEGQSVLVKYKAAVGISKLLHLFRNIDVLGKMMEKNFFKKIGLLILLEGHPFLKLKAVEIMSSTSRVLTCFRLHTLYLNRQTIPPSLLLLLLKEKYITIAQQSVPWILQLLRNGYQLDQGDQTQTLLDALSPLAVGDYACSRLVSSGIIKIIKQICSRECSFSSSAVEAACQVMFKLVEQNSSGKLRNQVFFHAASVIQDACFVKKISKIVSQNGSKMFIEQIPSFCGLFRQVLQSQVGLGEERIRYFDAKILLKYLNCSKLRELMMVLGILEEACAIFLKEVRERRKDCWVITVSSLNILSKILTKNCKETVFVKEKVKSEGLSLWERLEDLQKVERQAVSKKAKIVKYKIFTSGQKQ